VPKGELGVLFQTQKNYSGENLRENEMSVTGGTYGEVRSIYKVLVGENEEKI
jgi:hypothetical protein